MKKGRVSGADMPLSVFICWLVWLVGLETQVKLLGGASVLDCEPRQLSQRSGTGGSIFPIPLVLTCWGRWGCTAEA